MNRLHGSKSHWLDFDGQVSASISNDEHFENILTQKGVPLLDGMEEVVYLHIFGSEHIDGLKLTIITSPKGFFNKDEFDIRSFVDSGDDVLRKNGFKKYDIILSVVEFMKIFNRDFNLAMTKPRAAEFFTLSNTNPELLELENIDNV